MISRVSVIFCLMCGAAAVSVDTTAGYASHLKGKGSAVSKVIEMLADMKSKGEQEVQDEKVAFAEFSTFCEGAEKDKVQRIEASKESIGNLEGEIGNLELEIDQLAASIKKADSDIAALGAKIASLDAALKKIANGEEEVSEERKKEHADFEKKDKDLGEGVDALDRAIVELKSQDVDHPHAALVQVMQHNQRLPAPAKRVLTSFLQRAPEADAYEFQSEGVVNLFEDLEHKMADEKSKVEQDEANRQHAYRMLMQDLQNRMDRTAEQREEDIGLKAEKARRLAEARGEKADTEATLHEDEKYLKELQVMCKQKTAEFEARQELRQGELAAIGQAIEIMQSKVALVDMPHRKWGAAASFVQVRSSTVPKRVMDLLQTTTLGKPILALLAAKTDADVFAKLKKMIDDMITKLMEEANKEAEQKAFCDAEMGANKHTRDRKTEEGDRLSAEIEHLGATVTKLTEQLADLNTNIADMDVSVKEATANREAEKSKNAATLADAKSAEDATSQALAVLKEFYAKAAEATAFVQQPSMDEVYQGSMSLVKQFKEGSVEGTPAGDAPKSWNEAYQGSSASSGVMGLLEVIQSDFAGLIEETNAAETESEDAFTKLMNDATTNRAVKETDVKHTNANIVEKKSAMAEAKKDLAATNNELGAAMDYYEKLKPQCVDEAESFEDRVAARKAEIESLKEALDILNGSTIA